MGFGLAGRNGRPSELPLVNDWQRMPIMGGSTYVVDILTTGSYNVFDNNSEGGSRYISVRSLDMRYELILDENVSDVPYVQVVEHPTNLKYTQFFPLSDSTTFSDLVNLVAARTEVAVDDINTL